MGGTADIIHATDLFIRVAFQQHVINIIQGFLCNRRPASADTGTQRQGALF